MAQFTVTLDLEDYVKPSEIRKFIKNIKGVSKVSSLSASFPSSQKNRENDKEWLKMVDKLRDSVNFSDFDMNDERTRYILGEKW